MALLKQKKNKHAKVKSNHATADGGMELLSDSKDDATPKLKKKTKKKTMENSSPVKDKESSFAETPKLKKKKRKAKEEKSTVGLNDAKEILHVNQDEETQRVDVNQETEDMDNEDSKKVKKAKKIKTKKIKKSGKANKADKHAASKENNIESHVEVTTANVDGTEDVDEIPSVDEDCSRGMKKWILEYKQKRPGLKILQERIDEFIISHEEQQEKERKEREERAAEEGWTVVVHHKGRKKTTDAETGTAVGSVSLAAMQEKMANKKPKEVAPNFYRFQKREAHLSELAMLKSKFEQDKKRIQELRAQRKFKPY
ncbi:hypothetical protein QOZ80_2AG0102220 [Eleusine coracana subsp. coracana]|nr:hypothetical protein QOZ80_2AG0102220 [Eleusine coracana subsp. coracana]